MFVDEMSVDERFFDEKKQIRISTVHYTATYTSSKSTVNCTATYVSVGSVL